MYHIRESPCTRKSNFRNGLIQTAEAAITLIPPETTFAHRWIYPATPCAYFARDGLRARRSMTTMESRERGLRAHRGDDPRDENCAKRVARSAVVVRSLSNKCLARARAHKTADQSLRTFVSRLSPYGSPLCGQVFPQSSSRGRFACVNVATRISGRAAPPPPLTPKTHAAQMRSSD